MERPISCEFIEFHRREEMQRLKNKLTRRAAQNDNPMISGGQAREAR
jgi:hypothetical protein